MTSEQFAWTTSSYSSNRGGDCVEVAHHTAPTPAYALRDSKHRGHGHLTFPYAEWLAFVAAVKRQAL